MVVLNEVANLSANAFLVPDTEQKSICCNEDIVYKTKCSGCGELSASKDEIKLGE